MISAAQGSETAALRRPPDSVECRRSSERLAEPQLADREAAELGVAGRPVRAVAGGVVDGQRALVALVGVEEGLATPRVAKHAVRGVEQAASDAASGRGGVDEQQVELP